MEFVNIKILLGTLLYAGMGIVILLATYFLIEKLTPENIWHEIVKNKNIAVAIVFSAIIIGIAMIISAAIHG